jgi:predicted nuclease of restriction endonuclease-like (RecB) superfamily
MKPATTFDATLLNDLRALIQDAQQRMASSVNAELSLLYWQVGRRIQTEVLKGGRAEYGQRVLATLAEHLTRDVGRGWSEKLLRHCLRLAETFQDEAIFSALRRELSWTHLRTLIYLDDPLKRDFYCEMCRLEKWSSRQLQDRIQSMLFERTAISRKPEETIRRDLVTLREEGRFPPDLAFRDPYLLDFLGLADSYSEKDLESAILAELQRFIIELGGDFAFLARQKRITIDNRDYYIDLLFFHRRLKCLVAVDLKIGEFEAGFKGQMELYLRYLERHERMDGEGEPVGLILCTGKQEEHVELMRLDESNIRVADYLTVLPPRETLRAKLHQSMEIARQRLAMLEGDVEIRRRRPGRPLNPPF